jgi:molybdate transport system substrate-binding protein
LKLRGLGSALAAIAALAGSAPEAARAGDALARPALRILAAASLIDVVGALRADFSEASLAPSFGASSELARQAADGAPGDVLLSASPEWIDYLAEKGTIAGEPLVFASNALVCVTARGSRLASKAAAGVAELPSALRVDDRLALAAVGVPAGDYARDALAAQGSLRALESRIVRLRDVRAVLQAVEYGEAEAGFVYATDARNSGVITLFRVEASSHRPIRYVAAALRQSERPELAQHFLAFLRGPNARARLESAGFGPP